MTEDTILEILRTVKLETLTAFVAGLAVGIFSRVALKVLIATAYVWIAYEILRSTGVL